MAVRRLLLLCILLSCGFHIHGQAPPAFPFGTRQEELRVWNQPLVQKLFLPRLNGHYVYPAQYGIILTSTDGENFTPRMTETRETFSPRAAYGNGLYLAVSINVVARSQDTVNWTVHPSPGLLKNVYFANGRFLATGIDTGTAWWSTDGTNWSPISIPRSYETPEILTTPSRFIVRSNPTQASTDAVTWAQVSSKFGVQAVAAAGAYFFAPGNGTALYYSVDGNQWSNVEVDSPRNAELVFSNIAFLDGAYYYIARRRSNSSPQVYFSYNLKTWSLVADSSNALGTFPKGEWMGYIEDIMPLGVNRIAFGHRDFVGSSAAIFLYSETNGWRDVSPTERITITSGAVSENTAVIVGAAGKVLTTRDGETWTATNSTTVQWNAVAHLNGEFVAVGDGGTFARSNDGLEWTVGSIPGAQDLTSVAFGNGVYVVLSGPRTGTGRYLSTALFTSENLVQWTKAPNVDGNILISVVFGNGHFFAARWIGPYLVSEDGYTWKAYVDRPNVSFMETVKAEYSGGWFFVRDRYGSTYTSGDLFNWQSLDVAGVSTALIGDMWIAHPSFIWKAPYFGPPSSVKMISRSDASEKGEVGRVAFVREGSAHLSLTIPIVTAGDAIPGTDYEAPASAIRIPPGQRSVELQIVGLPDRAKEEQERVRIELGPADYLRALSPAAEITLHDSATERFQAPEFDATGESYELKLELNPNSEHLLFSSPDLSQWEVIATLPLGTTLTNITVPFVGDRRYFRTERK